MRVELLAPQGWVAAAAAIGANAVTRSRHWPKTSSPCWRCRRRRADVWRRRPAKWRRGRRHGTLLPFEPRSFRDFMLYEAHAVDAARGFVRRFMPRPRPSSPPTRRDAAHVSQAQAACAVAPPADLLHGQSPDVRARRRRHRNAVVHAARSTTNSNSASCWRKPAARRRPATPKQPSAASSCSTTFRARDVQLAEMSSGFGPQKAKHFAQRHVARRRQRRRDPAALARS